MTHVLVPHFALPFQLAYDHGSMVPKVVEEDSVEDIISCVEAAMRTMRGERVDMPSFGMDDPTFQMLPLDLESIIAQISAHENRASIVMSETPDRLDALVDVITAEVSLREEARA
jgi:hypothetical protein